MAGKRTKEQNEYYDVNLTDGYPLARRVSYKKKRSNDFRWAKESINYIDTFYDSKVSRGRRNNNFENYELVNGRGVMFLDRMKKETDKVYTTIRGEKVSFDIDTVHHYPVINQVVQGLLGEMYKRHLVPMVKDYSIHSRNIYKERRDDLVSQWVNQTFIQPLQEQVVMELGGPEAIMQMPPNQQQQAQAYIQEKVEALSPEHIKDYLESGFMSPIERVGSEILTYSMAAYDVKNRTDKGFEHALPVGSEYYFVGIRNKRPRFDLINPVYFNWGGSQNVEKVEDGEWCIYEQYVTFADFLNDWGQELKRSDYKDLENILSNLGEEDVAAETRREILREYSVNPEAFAEIDQTTVEGQRMIGSLYRRFSRKFGEDVGKWKIRLAHVCWRAAAKHKLVYRKDPVTGEETSFYAGENYREDPLKGDYEVIEFWANEVWEGYKVGYGSDGLFLGIQRIPHQLRSADYPFEPKLPYVGGHYNPLMGNTAVSSLVDLGKKFQYDFDVEHARLRRDMGLNVGKVMLMLMDYIPEGWDYVDFIKSIHEHKLAPIQIPEGSVAHQYIGQMFKDIDMSTAIDIAQRIQLLRYYQDQIAISMYYNPSRLGQISPYVPVTNNQQNIVQSANQTEKLFKMHEEIVVRALNIHLESMKTAIDLDETFMTRVLSDVSLAYIRNNPEKVWNSEWAVFVTTSINDMEELSQMKELALSFAQNGYSPLDIALMRQARSMGELIDVLREVEKRRMEQIQAQAQSAQEQQQQMMALQAEMDQMRAAMERQQMIEGKEMDYERSIDTARAANEWRVQQWDIDNDNQSDLVEKEEAKQKADRQENAADRAFQRSENEKDRELERLKLKSSNSQSKSK